MSVKGVKVLWDLVCIFKECGGFDYDLVFGIKCLDLKFIWLFFIYLVGLFVFCEICCGMLLVFGMILDFFWFFN